MHDWSLVEVFLRVAEHGSMTAAAGALGSSQPTVSRRIAALESRMGGPLFLRHSRGLALTERGRRLLEGATQLDRSLDALVVSDRDPVAGLVRVSAVEEIGAYLAPCWASLRQRHPRLVLDIRIEEALADLGAGAADLALRITRPQQPDLIGIRLGPLQLGLYASPAYLERTPRPRDVAELRRHSLIGLPSSLALLRYLAPYGLGDTDLGLRSASYAVRSSAVAAGAGIGGLLTQIADADPRLERVLPDLDLPPFELWLAVHRSLHREPAVRAVADAIRDTARQALERDGV